MSYSSTPRWRGKRSPRTKKLYSKEELIESAARFWHNKGSLLYAKDFRNRSNQDSSKDLASWTCYRRQFEGIAKLRKHCKEWLKQRGMWNEVLEEKESE